MRIQKEPSDCASSPGLAAPWIRGSTPRWSRAWAGRSRSEGQLLGQPGPRSRVGSWLIFRQRAWKPTARGPQAGQGTCMTRGKSLSNAGGRQFNLHHVICPGLWHRDPCAQTDSYRHTRLVKTGNGGETEPKSYTIIPLLKDGGVRLSTKGFQIASWTHLQEKNIFKETNETPNGEQLLEKEERPKRPILWTWTFGNIRLTEPPFSSIPFFLYKVLDYSDNVLKHWERS